MYYNQTREEIVKSVKNIEILILLDICIFYHSVSELREGSTVVIL